MRPHEPEWLHISVAFDSQAREGFVLAVSFSNRSPTKQSVNWSYTNSMGKAEGHSLHLRCPDGGLLEPVEFMKGTTAIRGEHPEFPFGATQKYVLVGKIEQQRLLRFPGASYIIQPGARYEVEFHYGGVRSNTLVWHAPSET